MLPPPPHTHTQVWALRVDVHVLDHDGNLVDACCLAALAALMALRLPQVTVGGDSGSDIIVHSPDVKEPLPLSIHHLPVAISFALFEVRASRGCMCGAPAAAVHVWGTSCSCACVGHQLQLRMCAQGKAHGIARHTSCVSACGASAAPLSGYQAASWHVCVLACVQQLHEHVCPAASSWQV